MTIYGRSEELVSRCVECNLAEPESLASLGGSAPGLVDGILSTSSTLITMDEIKTRLKERYLQLKREHGWSEDEMALNMKSRTIRTEILRRGTMKSSSKEGATIVENLGTRSLIVGT